MGRKSKFISKLTEEQISSLKQGYSQGESPLYRRKCHAILQNNLGMSADQLSIFFQVDKCTVLHWFRLWEKEGLEGLQLKPGRGRKPKLKIDNPEHVKVVKTLIENENQNLTLVLGQVSDQLGVELSKKTLKRFLKNLNTAGNASVNV